MENLWKKEKIGEESLYIDYFNAIDAAYIASVDEKLQKFKAEHEHNSFKNNEKSTNFMRDANQKFQERDFERAVYIYINALRFAEIGTENVSMAFANRAKCFYQMKYYDQALIDIDLALEAGCNNEMMSKLQKLQTDCQNQIKSNTESHVFDEQKSQLKLQVNEQIPCLTDALAIANNHQFGRHLIATRDIAVGEYVLMEESFASVDRNTGQKCYTCLAEAKNFIPCPKCADVIFCDEKCMNANAVHKLDCNTLFHQMESKVRFIIRTILVAVTAFQSVEDLMAFVADTIDSDDLPQTVHSIQSKYQLYLKLKRFALNKNTPLNVYNVFRSIMTIPSLAELFDSQKKQRFLAHLLLHHLAVNVNNGFENHATTSISVLICLLNHSCAPNLHNYAIGSRKFCIAIRPVKKGEQLFISYLGGHSNQPTEKRQCQLKKSWNFECKCDRCEPRSGTIDSKEMQQDSCYKFVYRRYKGESNCFENATLVKKKCIKFLQKYGRQSFSSELEFITDIYKDLI